MFVSQLFAALWASAALLIPGAVGCSAEAADKHLKGDERQSFISQCLRADKTGKGRLS